MEDTELDIEPIMIDVRENPVAATQEIFRQNAVSIARRLVAIAKGDNIETVIAVDGTLVGVPASLKMQTDMAKYILDHVLKPVEQGSKDEQDLFKDLEAKLKGPS